MINPETEHIYNIILSIFMGIIVILIIDQMFESPPIIIL